MGKRGPKPKKVCAAGHDLTDPDNVSVVRRKKGEKVYKERQCRPCRNKRTLKYYHKNKEAA